VPEEKRVEVRCRRCEAEEFTAARACGAYEGALRASVLALKREPHVAARLSHLMLETQRRSPLNVATRIVPVPLHPWRERERGFNQAAVLAQALAKASGLPVDEWSLARTLHTERHRAGMDARARRESVADAFEVRRPRLIEGERILLMDDVFTTGATASSCASALKKAGAQEVFVLTVARPIT
jgi:ComF family protein